jgi:2,5-diamino-6-(ribosylamino)-4(3H)-pyrimidinone 5'-phosphate reductase
MARPYVVVHSAVSIEAATTGFAPDLARFYGLAATWQENVTLVGADTILAQEQALAATPGPGPAEDGPLLAVVDGRGRVREWAALRDAGHWSGVLALHSEATPPRPAGRDVEELVVGAERVDLAAALAALGERGGVSVARVDSGGSLTGALLRDGLVDEISLLVHPCLVDTTKERFWYGAGAAPGSLDLVASETFDGGVVWLRYRLQR